MKFQSFHGTMKIVWCGYFGWVVRCGGRCGWTSRQGWIIKLFESSSPPRAVSYHHPNGNTVSPAWNLLGLSATCTKPDLSFPNQLLLLQISLPRHRAPSYVQLLKSKSSLALLFSWSHIILSPVSSADLTFTLCPESSTSHRFLTQHLSFE